VFVVVFKGVFLFKSCIRLFSAEPDRAKLTRDKELAWIRGDMA